MGSLMIALGRLTLSPEPTAELMKDFLLFTAYFCPPEYHKDNVGLNPWFFDKNNKLVCLGGKLCEPEVWYNHLQVFFKKRGYQLIGDPQIVWEEDVDIDVRKIEYDRVIERCDNRKILEQKFLCDDIRMNDEISVKE